MVPSTCGRPRGLHCCQVANLSRLNLHQIDVPPHEAVELAQRESLTAYDAAYLWLARSLGCELVTLDRALAAAARPTHPPG